MAHKKGESITNAAFSKELHHIPSQTERWSASGCSSLTWSATRTVLEGPLHHAMISVIGFPWSISKRFRPGISSLRESNPIWRRMVAWMSVT